MTISVIYIFFFFLQRPYRPLEQKTTFKFLLAQKARAQRINAMGRGVQINAARTYARQLAFLWKTNEGL